MKHPALARVFSVILAILSVLTFFAGIKGFDDTANSNRKALEEADKLEKRRLSYIELSAQLDGRRTYKEVNDELTENREQHDSDAAEHRTDLAEYSAKRGGYTMGADMLWEAKNEIAGAKQAFEDAKGMLLGVQAQKDAMTAAAAGCNNAAAQCDAASKTAGDTAAALEEKMNSEPKFDEPVPPIPVAPLDTMEEVMAKEPENPTKPDVPDDEDNKAVWDIYREKEAQHTAWENYAAMVESYPSRLAQYESDKAAYDEKYAEFLNTSYQPWFGGFMAAAGGGFTAVSGAAAAAGAALNNAVAVMPDEMKSMLPGIDSGGGMPDIGSIGGDPAQIINSLYSAQGIMASLAGTLGTVSGGLGAAVTAMDNEIANQINTMSGGELTITPGTDANTIIAMMDAMLKKGEGQVESGLADIWYNMGELEKDKERLEEEKTTLDEETSALQTQQAEADELKELERQLTSDRVVLTKVAEIKEGVDDGEKLEVSAERYIAKFRAETETNRKNGLIMSALAAMAGVLGVASVPAAYEKIKKRFWLLVPPALCGALALGSMLLSRGVSDTLYYSTMATVIFAVIHLLVVIPREKVTV